MLSPTNGSAVNGAVPANGAAEDLDAERARLEAEIAAARTRAAVARQRIATRDADVQELMRHELAETRDLIAEMDRRHQEALAEIRRATDDRIDQILAEARESVGLAVEVREAGA